MRESLLSRCYIIGVKRGDMKAILLFMEAQLTKKQIQPFKTSKTVSFK